MKLATDLLDDHLGVVEPFLFHPHRNVSLRERAAPRQQGSRGGTHVVARLVERVAHRRRDHHLVDHLGRVRADPVAQLPLVRCCRPDRERERVDCSGKGMMQSARRRESCRRQSTKDAPWRPSEMSSSAFLKSSSVQMIAHAF